MNKYTIIKSLSIIPDKPYIMARYLIKLKRLPKLNNPISFTEKIQWLKLYYRRPEYAMMVDKVEVKEYVANKIGDKYVTKTLAVFNNISEINIDELPNQFVLKCTHDSGGILICRDKGKIDWGGVQQKFAEALNRNFYYLHREWQYKNVKPRVIVEEYLENDPEEGLHDYKVWCFNGKAKYVQYITGRIGNSTLEGFFDEEWNLQPFSYFNPILETSVPRPIHLDKLFELASILAEGIPFVRIDFYVLPDDSIRFGEITFYPMSGIVHFHPEYVDKEFGRMIDLPPRFS